MVRFRELCQYNAPKRVLTKYSKCRYQTRNSAYRLLMPFKEEDVSKDPYVKIYHDVLYDGEIENFKKFASEDVSCVSIIFKFLVKTINNSFNISQHNTLY